ncbi:hypothetical protein COU57_05570 [Candidatus Pacearchaeota archaeon CG10_big_fil_rev_8_21_14_0_10_32_14]|nr:MAG: hypothetical protein COU57_05570 [Candidatus Pacearchaeota archaeon CG10_big_fil_rev_8_21_14_0_10_32_14]
MSRIVINDKNRFGKPVIDGTRITVEEVIGAIAGGMTFDEIEAEYGISKEEIKFALEYAVEILSEEKIGILKSIK